VPSRASARVATRTILTPDFNGFTSHVEVKSCRQPRSEEVGKDDETGNGVSGRNVHRGAHFSDAGPCPAGNQENSPWDNGFSGRLPNRDGLAEIAPSTCGGRHTHPGIETSYILEGEGVSKVDGRPDRPVKADTIQIPANVPHDGCATTRAAKILTVHVVEKGEPLGSPVP